MKSCSSERLYKIAVVAGLIVAAAAAAAEARPASKANAGKTVAAPSASVLSPHNDATRHTRTYPPYQLKKLQCRRHGSKRCE